MPDELIVASTSPFDAIRRMDDRGDYWTGRDLMPLLGYDKWERMVDAIERARISLANAGDDPDAHASRLREPSGRTERVNYRLTRHGAYIVAMAADVRKTEVASAQAYFALRTRQAEVAIPEQRELTQDEKLALLAQGVLDAQRQTREERAEKLAAQTRVAELEPAADSWNTLATAHGDYSVADAAKVLSTDPSIKLGQNRLYRLLGDLKWLYRPADQRWRAYQQHVDNKHLSLIAMSHYHPRTGELVIDPPQIRITVKGLGWLHRHLGGTRALALPAEQLSITGSRL